MTKIATPMDLTAVVNNFSCELKFRAIEYCPFYSLCTRLLFQQTTSEKITWKLKENVKKFRALSFCLNLKLFWAFGNFTVHSHKNLAVSISFMFTQNYNFLLTFWRSDKDLRSETFCLNPNTKFANLELHIAMLKTTINGFHMETNSFHLAVAQLLRTFEFSDLGISYRKSRIFVVNNLFGAADFLSVCVCLNRKSGLWLMVLFGVPCDNFHFR